MRSILVSSAKSLGLGALLLVCMILLVEGWPVYVTVIGTVTLFALAGFIDARWQRSPRWFCTLLVCLPFLALFTNLSGLALGAHLLVSPGEIDHRNFYALLPLVSLAGVYSGAALGRITRRPSPAIPAPAAP